MSIPPMSTQVRWWNDWLTSYRETEIGDVSEDQARQVLEWVTEIHAEGGRPLDIIDVGCGGGWLCSRLARFGRITGTDLADEVVARAAERDPDIRYVAGDFMELDFGTELYDVVITLEVLSHVADQPAFCRKLASLLRPGGALIVANQNRWVLERNEGIMPLGEGQIRKWTTRSELRALLSPHVRVTHLTTLTPKGHRGALRVLNSEKLGRMVTPFVGGPARLRRLRERAGLGWTVIARSTRGGRE